MVEMLEVLNIRLDNSSELVTDYNILATYNI